MRLDLSSFEETGSFLVPAYAIVRGIPGREAVPRERSIGPCEGPEETYAALQRDELRLQPRGTAKFLFGASAAFNDAVRPHGGQFTVRLREAATPAEPDLSNACLMVHGMRTCARRRQDRTDVFPGFASWSETTEAHDWISARGASAPNRDGFRQKLVTSGRSGRGALHVPLGDGIARLLLLDFHVMDRDPALPDLLFVWASRTDVPEDGFPDAGPRGERLDEAWRELILRARAGFRSENGP